MQVTHGKNLSRKEDGQSLVEFALVLPILIVLIFGVIEFGRLWMTVNTLSGAAREGVRVAAVTAPDAALVNNAVNNILTAANITGATITMAGPNAASEVTVTVQMNYTVLTASILPGLSGTLQLTRSATMRWES
jgi:Flp pilus assembly protein TadG